MEIRGPDVLTFFSVVRKGFAFQKADLIKACNMYCIVRKYRDVDGGVVIVSPFWCRGYITASHKVVWVFLLVFSRCFSMW